MVQLKPSDRKNADTSALTPLFLWRRFVFLLERYAEPPKVAKPAKDHLRDQALLSGSIEGNSMLSFFSFIIATVLH